MRWMSLVMLLSCAGTVHAAGKVWIVDAPGAGADFYSLATAVATVGDGDIILVRSMLTSWETAVVNGKSLVICADAGFSPEIHGDIVVVNLGDSQSVALRGLDVVAGEFTPAMTLESNSGSVWVEDCSLHGGGISPLIDPFGFGKGYPAMSVLGCNSVVVSGSTLEGGSCRDGEAALSATGSIVHVFGSTLTGAAAHCDLDLPPNCGSHSGAGLFVDGGFVSVQSASLIGGAASPGWKGDLPFCFTFEFGAAGLWLQAGDVELYDVLVQAGGATLPCGLPGPETTHVVSGTLSAEEGSGLRAELSSPLPAGGGATVSFEGAPGDLVFIAVAAAPGDVWVPKFNGPWLLGSPSTITPVLVLGPGGVATVLFPVPNLPPGLEGFSPAAQVARLSASGGLLANGMRPVVVGP